MVLAVVLLSAAALAGCGSTDKYEPAPPGYYRIRSGDTLLEIAGRYKVGYRTLAGWNGLEPPYMIYAGSLLRVEPPPGTGQRVAGAPIETRPTRAKKVKGGPKTGRTGGQTSDGKGNGQSRTQATASAGPAGKAAKTAVPVKTSASARPAGASQAAAPGLGWQWPLKGEVVQAFRAGDRTRQGIRIAGRPDQKVRAAAGGTVVYSGSGLKAYGNLIIIKHIDGYLSAYGFNRRLLVTEGARVKSGQVVAELGQASAMEYLLHFEIRRNGIAVDPLEYLP